MFVSERFSIFVFGLLEVVLKNHGIQNIPDWIEDHKIESPSMGQAVLGNMMDC